MNIFSGGYPNKYLFLEGVQIIFFFRGYLNKYSLEGIQKDIFRGYPNEYFFLEGIQINIFSRGCPNKYLFRGYPNKYLF